MNIKVTDKGWLLDITNTRDGCLVQGGVCGRKEFFSFATLEKRGIPRDADPDDQYNDHYTNAEYVHQSGMPCDKVIRRGQVIQ